MTIGITLGDPSGIGPEIIAKTLTGRVDLADSVVIFGDVAVLERAGLAGHFRIEPVTRLDLADAIPGQPSLAGAGAQVAYLEAAVGAVKAGSIHALVTAPISKTQAKKAGFAFPGHTEFLAERLGTDRPCEHAMMFSGPRLNVVLATIHHALAEVPAKLNPEVVARAIFLGGRAMARDLGVTRPRIGVLGLNPHAGEDGLFGHEEATQIAPGIDLGRTRLAADGLTCVVEGPLVPDAAYRTGCDLFVAMYHDQGLIPAKLLDFELSVNVTLGLPIPRTSPDHGTAYDIAGKGIARETSFAAALEKAEIFLSSRS